MITKEITYKKFKEFSGYKMVVTDRLHGMIFATVTNTPCIAFDNVSKKVSGVHAWINQLEYVKLADSNTIDTHLIEEIYSCKNHSYNPNLLSKYFSKITASIKKTD